MRRRGSHGWREISAEDKRDVIDAIASGRAPKGPLHLELDISDRCNVDCYFCNAMDVRTKENVPFERVTQILDDAVSTGLRSVRFAGGGDPLFHRNIEQVIDYVHSKGLVVDNITSNALGLSHGVAEKMVAGKTREIVVSLNAADADDYARMMQVKPAIFDKVVANVEHLVALRGEREHPCIVVQFLVDRANYAKMPQMYELGRRIGADIIVINLVLEIPRKRVDPKLVWQAGDAETLRPLFREVLIADRDAGLLELSFEFESWNAMLRDLETELGTTVRTGYTTSPSFKVENGGCFFGYYTAVVRGNGDMYPCCMLINPEYTPIANAMHGSFNDQWQGEGFTRLRGEMREVLLAGGAEFYSPERFKTLKPQCVDPHACGLKNMYFRGDDDFYRDLGKALDAARAREIRFIGNRQQIARALRQVKHRHPRLRNAYERLASASPAFRRTIKKLLGVRYTGS
jgi:MoaA/NifB/PqqE/SkfB family radical SAM enzyme